MCDGHRAVRERAAFSFGERGSRRRSIGRFLGAAAVLFAAAAARAASDCAPATLTIATSTTTLRQGSILAVTVGSDTPLSRATLSDGRRQIAMEASGDRRTLRALVGIDFESAPGKRRLSVEAVGPCGLPGRASRAVRIVAGRFPLQKLRVDPVYVEPPESELERIREEREKVGRVWTADESARLWRDGFRLPISSAAPGDFGARRVFNGKPRSRHDGVDLSAPQGTEVAAPAPAVVALAESLYFSGGTVILDHGGGLFTTYFHLSAIDVAAGQALAAGDRIGAVGATGRATGPHLHWGARLRRARVNPLDLLHLPAWPPGEPAIRLTGQSQ